MAGEQEPQQGVLTPLAKAEWEHRMAIADELGLPDEWRVCAHCGEQSWRLAPHMFEPCPFVKEMADAAGLKFDAERMQAIRMGTHVEEITRFFRENFTEEEDDDTDG